MVKSRQTIVGSLLVALSTACYYVPSSVYGSKNFDVNTIPKDFYNFYAAMLGGALLLNAVYATYLFILTDIKQLVLKLIFGWMVVGETYTVTNHVINRILRLKIYNGFEAIVTLIVLMTCCAFVLRQALYNQKSDKFESENTYIIRFLPKGLLGLVNYLFTLSGHYALYQDGKVYRFKKSSGKMETSNINSEFLLRKDVSFKRIGRISNIERLEGKVYNIWKYNCKDMVRDAQQGFKTS